MLFIVYCGMLLNVQVSATKNSCYWPLLLQLIVSNWNCNCKCNWKIWKVVAVIGTVTEKPYGNHTGCQQWHVGSKTGMWAVKLCFHKIFQFLTQVCQLTLVNSCKIVVVSRDHNSTTCQPFPDEPGLAVSSSISSSSCSWRGHRVFEGQTSVLRLFKTNFLAVGLLRSVTMPLNSSMNTGLCWWILSCSLNSSSDLFQ